MTYLTSFGSRSGSALPAPPGHALEACAPAAEEQSCVTIDLAAAYQGQGVAAASRRVALRLDGSVRVTDAWATEGGQQGGPVAAALQTYADVALSADRTSALLSRGGRQLRVALVGAAACAGAVLAASPVRLHSPFYTTYNLTRIDVRGVSGPACTGFDVTLTGVA